MPNPTTPPAHISSWENIKKFLVATGAKLQAEVKIVENVISKGKTTVSKDASAAWAAITSFIPTTGISLKGDIAAVENALGRKAAAPEVPADPAPITPEVKE